jgi:hypothetical protein
VALSPTVKRLVVGAAVAAALVAAFGFLRFKRFVDEDPRLCATCHRASPEFALWTNGSHRQVSCQRCHHATPAQGVAMLRAFLAGKTPAGKHAQVEVGACASCHFSHDPQWPQVGGSRGHKLHYEEKRIACVRCHSESMHGFEPLVSKCQECHPGHAVGVKGMEALHCFACHDFLSDEPGLRPTRRDCMRCHTAQGIHAPVAEHGAAMEISCASCHKPHAKAGETLVGCARCHMPADVAKGGLHAARGHARCVDCHPPHTWKASPDGCARCHAGAAGHARGRACTECHSFAGVPHPPAPLVP